MEFGNVQAAAGRRVMGLGGVALFHALLLWALVSGLARKAVEILPAPIETKILEERTAEEEPPPPPPPEFDEPPPPFISPPEINIASPPPASVNAITAVTHEAPPPTAPPAPKAAVRVPPVVKASACRQPEYPSMSERLGETGSVVLQLLVGVDGRVIDSRIARSSGYERLDRAAQEALSRCRFTAGTEDGIPIPAWAQMKYTFRQQN